MAENLKKDHSLSTKKTPQKTEQNYCDCEYNDKKNRALLNYK